MNNVTRTAALDRLITCQLWGLDFEIKPNSVINDVLNDATAVPNIVSPDTRGMYVPGTYEADIDTKDMKMGLLVLGRGGHGVTVDAENEISLLTYPHKSSDTGLFSPIPLIARPVASDLTFDDRQRYRLRRTVMAGGQLMAFYFGVKLDLTSTQVNQVIETVEGKTVINSVPYEPTQNDLKPEKTDISTVTDAKYLRTYAFINIGLNENQVEEMIEACTLLYGNPNKAVVSEIAYCFGIDKPVTGIYPNTGTQTVQPAPANTFEFVATHMGIVESTYKPVTTTGAFSDPKNIGLSEPLYGL